MKDSLRFVFAGVYAAGGLLLAYLLEVALLYLDAVRIWVKENRMFVESPLHLLDTYNNGKKTPLEFDYFAITLQDLCSNWLLIPIFIALVFWLFYRITGRDKLSLKDHGVNLLVLLLAFGVFAGLGALNWVEPFAITRAVILCACLGIVAIASIWTQPLIKLIALERR